MENINSIISNNPSYLALLTKAPEPVKFDSVGIVPKVDNTAKFIVLGLLGIMGGIVIYILWDKEKQVRESQNKNL